MSRREKLLASGEWACAAGLAAFVLWIHVENLLRASALWRDEISTLHIAGQPTLSGLWSVMEWESSPLLWPLTLRSFIGLGFGTDAESLRALAFLVGVAIVISLFVALWRIAGALPLLCLLLVAANPNVLRFGDTLRAYGLGLLLVILLVVAFWELGLRVTRGRIAAAALLSILAVQCLYHDAVVILALGTGCASAWAYRRRFREALVPLAIGCAAALTLLPYGGPLARAREWNVIFRAPVDLAWLAGRVRQSVEVGGPWLSFVWVGLVFAALAVCVLRFRRLAQLSESVVEPRAQAVFTAVSLVVGIAGFAAFLILVGYPTQPWYYLSLLGLVAVLCECSLARELRAGLRYRALRLGVVAVGFALTAPGIWQLSTVRMTNLDRVAATLTTRARPDDLIIVTPWYLGISFDHYYAGVTPWLSIPDLADRKLTRYDLVKEQMTRPEALRPVLERVEATLERQGRVWLIGSLPFRDGNPSPSPAPVAPDSALGWSESEYQFLWSRAVAHRLQLHSRWVTQVAVEGVGNASVYESPPLFLFESAP